MKPNFWTYWPVLLRAVKLIHLHYSWYLKEVSKTRRVHCGVWFHSLACDVFRIYITKSVYRWSCCYLSLLVTFTRLLCFVASRLFVYLCKPRNAHFACLIVWVLAFLQSYIITLFPWQVLIISSLQMFQIHYVLKTLPWRNRKGLNSRIYTRELCWFSAVWLALR